MIIDDEWYLPTELRHLVEFLKALAGETRLRVLALFLRGGELSVNDVARHAGIGQSTASESLGALKRTGVLRSRREGRQVFYRADRAQALELVEDLRRYLATCCAD